MHHWVGVACIVVGVAEVGYIAIAFEDSEESSSGGSVAFGIILLLIA
jgi:hypothetical protein